MTTTAQRVVIQHAVAQRADELRRALDPATLPQTPDEWTARLVGSLGCVACAGEHGEAEHYIVEHAATVLLWLENLVAESAR